MSVTALVSELSECELSDQGCTATYEFVRRADSYPTTACQLLRRNVLKDFGKGPGMTSPLQLSDRVRWVRVLLGLPWTGMSRCGNLIKTPPSTAVCSLHPCQLSQQACEGRTHRPGESAELRQGQCLSNQWAWLLLTPSPALERPPPIREEWECS